MKRIKKYISESPKLVLLFVLGAIVFSVVGVKAASILAASEVVYDNSSSSISSTNVQGAIDELYAKADEKAQSKLCKKGYYTTSDGSSNYTCTKVAENQSVITLRIRVSGTKNVLGKSFFNEHAPSRIYVNGVLSENNDYRQFLGRIDNIVVMIWDNPIDNMANMFYSCYDITSIDFSNFDTSHVTDMSYMFYDCQKLSNLNFSDFNTSNVTNMNSMFYRNYALTSLDLSSFNTSNVTDMSYMFFGCKNLSNLNVSNFDTDKVTSMERMFGACQKLTSLDVSNFNTSNVTNMNSMFSSCQKLTSLDLSNFNTSNVTDMSYMFCYCSSLTNLDLSSFIENASSPLLSYSIFDSTSDNLKIKLNCNNAPKIQLEAGSKAVCVN